MAECHESTSRGGATVKFEKVSIGRFEGDIRKYPKWRNDFQKVPVSQFYAFHAFLQIIFQSMIQ